MKRTLILVLACGAAATMAAAQDTAAATLCTPDERVVFSCAAANAKVISLCSSSRLTPDSGYLQYRFGQGGKPELVYPAGKEHPRRHFQYGTQMYSGGGSAFLKFNNGDYTYTVFSGMGKGWAEEGVVVTKSGKQVAYLKCKGAATDGLDAEWFNKIGIPEDPAAGDFEIPSAQRR